MTHPFSRRVTLPPTAAAVAVLLLAAHAVPSVVYNYTLSAAIPIGYVGTAETVGLTDFDTGIVLPRISPADGAQITSTSITVTLGAGMFGDFSAAGPTATRFYRNQTAEVSAAITVAPPDPSATPLDAVLPFVSRIFGLVHRQVVSQENLSGSSTSTRTTDASDSDFDAFASLFLGTGTVALPVSAVGTSRFSGSGNVRLAVNTSVGATTAITAEYLTEAAVVPDLAGAGGVSRPPAPGPRAGESDPTRRRVARYTRASPPTGQIL